MLGAALAGSAPASAQCSGINLVEQKFPVTGPKETRWRVCWQEQAKNGLVITAAFFRQSPSAPWVRILWDGRISEIFVPYHDGNPRYYDVTNFADGEFVNNAWVGEAHLMWTGFMLMPFNFFDRTPLSPRR